MDKDDFLNSYKEYNRYVFSYVYFRVANSKEVAEDITQESFIRAWKYREKYNKARSGFKVWIISISRNVVSDYFNKNPKLSELTDETVTTHTEETKGRNEDSNLDIYYLMNKLNARERELIRLRYMLEFKITEIGEILGEDSNNLKVEIFRIVQKLKEIFNTKANG